MREIDRQIKAIRDLCNADTAILFSANRIIELLVNREYGEQELLHTSEVYGFASELLRREKVEDPETRQIVFLASVLHDVGRYLENPNIRHHTEVTRRQLASFIDFPEQPLLDRITKCIQRHSISSQEKPEILEEKIVFDADNLTLFTEFGVKRWFFKAEAWGQAKNVQEAERHLEKLYSMAKSGQLLFLDSSLSLLAQSHYAKSFKRVSSG